MNKRAVWFGRAVWLGVLANCVLAIPAIFAPNATLEFVGQRPSQDPVWTAFAALLLVLLSAFYIPGANNPYRYLFNAWLAVLARTCGVIFFFFLYPGLYPIFGLLDLTFFIIQGVLLILMLTATPRPRWQENQ